MSGQSEVLPKKWARAYSNGKIFAVRTFSGYNATIGDPEGSTTILVEPAADEEVGHGLVASLQASRFLDSPEKLRNLSASRELSYAEFVDRLLKAGGYKNRRALFKAMASCSIEQVELAIVIRPTHHRSLEAWSGDGIDENDNIVISAANQPSDIGSALRDAFKRCT